MPLPPPPNVNIREMRGYFLCCLLISSSFALDCKSLHGDLNKFSIGFKQDSDTSLTKDGKMFIGSGLSPERTPCGDCSNYQRSDPTRKECAWIGECRHLDKICKKHNVVYETKSPVDSSLSDFHKWQLRFYADEACDPGFNDGFQH